MPSGTRRPWRARPGDRALEPGRPEAWTERGGVRFLEGRYDEARRGPAPVAARCGRTPTRATCSPPRCTSPVASWKRSPPGTRSASRRSARSRSGAWRKTQRPRRPPRDRPRGGRDAHARGPAGRAPPARGDGRLRADHAPAAAARGRHRRPRRGPRRAPRPRARAGRLPGHHRRRTSPGSACACATATSAAAGVSLGGSHPLAGEPARDCRCSCSGRDRSACRPASALAGFRGRAGLRARRGLRHAPSRDRPGPAARPGRRDRGERRPAAARPRLLGRAPGRAGRASSPASRRASRRASSRRAATASTRPPASSPPAVRSAPTSATCRPTPSCATRGSSRGPRASRVERSVLAVRVRGGWGSDGLPVDEMYAPGVSPESDLPLRAHPLTRGGVLGANPIGRSRRPRSTPSGGSGSLHRASWDLGAVAFSDTAGSGRPAGGSASSWLQRRRGGSALFAPGRADDPRRSCLGPRRRAPHAVRRAEPGFLSRHRGVSERKICRCDPINRFRLEGLIGQRVTYRPDHQIQHHGCPSEKRVGRVGPPATIPDRRGAPGRRPGRPRFAGATIQTRGSS